MPFRIHPLLFVAVLLTLALYATPIAHSQSGNGRPLAIASPETPPRNALVLFDGTHADHWVRASNGKPIGWKVADGALEVAPGAGDIITKEKFRDYRLHLEFNVPYRPFKHGQERGNSGIKLDGLYEIQILDSYGLPPDKGECGAVYNQVPPRVNACKLPMEWQTYDISFRQPRFDAQKHLVRKGSVTVYQNGVLVQDATDIEKPTRNDPKFDATQPGPVLLQEHGSRVRFRNVWIQPMRSSELVR